MSPPPLADGKSSLDQLISVQFSSVQLHLMTCIDGRHRDRGLILMSTLSWSFNWLLVHYLVPPFRCIYALRFDVPVTATHDARGCLA